MLLNAKTAISTSKVLLVPYSKWHVPRYHEWMKDPEIQEATASEPLTLEEEYTMQQSWRQDPDKLTFIVCQPVSGPLTDQADSPANMIGDINLFLRVDDGEEGGSEPLIVGEIELMIAEKGNQRRGFGKAALLSFLRYVADREGEILEEFVRGDEVAKEAMGKKVEREWEGGLKFSCLSVKIGQGNERSLALFEGASFKRVTEEPNYFGEFELRRTDLGRESMNRGLESAGVNGYVEMEYGRSEQEVDHY
ncbi:hypothetical protein P170DRAFT_432160 [Aspergillus steynii IBT 23096]|uniref:N-acetyltransferase domain-containing protein n=1 Tax=Aspergillus steynii IBT 23096 TaxID=1392250 RepID=A0A2I2GNQ1_9EURO|nr:uncharacterized protein P170DRAFT_432160 [Aspergillus steynii IBT 23096]PLB54511.1 hypothetical protein P170DRAFT_432160 [Aspergillus steynii IBT 23096]